jgi:hypothetical protein
VARAPTVTSGGGTLLLVVFILAIGATISGLGLAKLEPAA